MLVTKYEVNRNVDLEASAVIREKLNAVLGNCYINAFTSLPYCGPDALYVEGLAASEDFGIPMDHGWVQMLDGKIVDATWAHLQPVAYMPLYVYDAENLNRQIVLANFKMPLMDSKRLISDRLSAEGYLAAFQKLVDEMKGG